MGTHGIAIDGRSEWRPKVGENLLDSLEGRNAVLNDLFETDPDDFGAKDVAVLNLLCAPTLKGADDLNIRRCLARLDDVTRQVKAAIDRNIHRLSKDPDYWHCPQMFKASWAVTVIKRYFGVAYNPTIAASTLAGHPPSPMDNARDIFINGVLDENPNRRHGTCASIPVMVAAVGRRLGWPIKLTVAGRHVLARWDGGGARFHIEATGPAGMVAQPDEYYRHHIIGGKTEEYRKSSFHLRDLTPAEEFTLFMTFRVEALCIADRLDETFLWSARSLQFSPDDPGFLAWAARSLNFAMRRRYKVANPGVEVPPTEGPAHLEFNVAPYLAPQEQSLYLTITAHLNDSWGDVEEARIRFEDACRTNFHGNNEQRDLQRFLKKHGLARNAAPVLPPNKPITLRFKFEGEPHRHALVLMQLAHQLEADGQFVKARDALHDLYMIDPSQAGVFRRARMLEARPEFQSQLRASIAERRLSPSKVKNERKE